ncbi:MAG: hypothetical protein IJ007_09765 [Oscillospiraceae bacterium]|nr:hypothetical protein [Oscillospiraceae bacterium]
MRISINEPHIFSFHDSMIKSIAFENNDLILKADEVYCGDRLVSAKLRFCGCNIKVGCDKSIFNEINSGIKALISYIHFERRNGMFTADMRFETSSYSGCFDIKFDCSEFKAEY